MDFAVYVYVHIYGQCHVPRGTPETERERETQLSIIKMIGLLVFLVYSPSGATPPYISRVMAGAGTHQADRAKEHPARAKAVALEASRAGTPPAKAVAHSASRAVEQHPAGRGRNTPGWLGQERPLRPPARAGTSQKEQTGPSLAFFWRFQTFCCDSTAGRTPRA